MQIVSSRTAAPMQKAFYAALALTLAFKFWLAHALPMTGDEAYFVSWGVYPAFGYYDHPPMVGWILALLLRLSRAEWVLRLPVIVLPALLALGMLQYLRRVDRDKAYVAALAYLLLPANVWNVLITTDVPLVLFSFFSALSFAVALRRESMPLFALAGALLGLAVLSKYFAVLLALAYLMFVLTQPAGRRAWRGLVLTLCVMLPFAALNARWNYNHCWANLMFNVYNRNDDAALTLRNPLLYALSVLYMISPVALFQMWRARRAWDAARADARLRFFMLAWGLPFALFALLSLQKEIGLHWLLSFVPFFFIAAAMLLDAAQLRKSATYLCAFSAIHVAVIVTASMLPVETWRHSRLYDGIVFQIKTAELLQHLQPYAGKYEFAADGYSPAVTASYAADKYFFVFGKGSSHARRQCPEKC